MGIWGDSDDGEEIAEPVEAAPPAEPEADPDLVRVRISVNHNGMHRGDEMLVTPERAEEMSAAGTAERV